jgi:hypothetical protein
MEWLSSSSVELLNNLEVEGSFLIATIATFFPSPSLELSSLEFHS